MTATDILIPVLLLTNSALLFQAWRNRYSSPPTESDTSQQSLACKIIALLQGAKPEEAIIQEVVEALQDELDMECVGLRLQHGDDYPYYICRGFSDSFIQAENSLCATDDEGALLRDAEGNCVLECMCGNILRSRFNPQLPFFTANGSFWTNSTSQLLASTTEEDRQARTRNRCNGEGYESVALIPLRFGQEAIGLLQLNDHRTDRFTPERIARLEELCFMIAGILVRNRTEEELNKAVAIAKANQGQLSTILSSVRDAILVLDAQGKIAINNVSAETLFGAAPNGLLGISIFSLLGNTQKGSARDGQDLQELLARDQEEGWHESEYRWSTFDGGSFIGLCALTPVPLAEKQGQGFVCSIRDISGQRRLELAAMKIEEQERRLLGRELHDELGQVLTGISLVAFSLSKELKDSSGRSTDKVESIIKYTGEAVQLSRNLAKGISLHSVDEGDLGAALSALAKATERRFSIECHCYAPHDIRFPPLQFSQLYRIAQEATNNAVRHGKASHIDLLLQEDSEVATLEILDDGSGITQPIQTEGMGLEIMRHRARVAGGSLSIGPGEDGGTRVLFQSKLSALLEENES
ncbi:MAG: ATP-binding protein [Planctomycetota bacterium]|jgi:PAS domain S-box-containing protein